MPTENLTLLQQFCQSHDIEIALIFEFQDFGLIEIIEEDNINYLSEENVAAIEKMIRLHRGLNINLEGIDVILQLLERIQHLQQEIVTLQNKNDFLSNVHH